LFLTSLSFSTHLTTRGPPQKPSIQNSVPGTMAPYDPYTKELTPPVSPFTDSFIPRDVAHLHHVPAPADMRMDDDPDACRDRTGSMKHKLNPLEQNHALPLLSSLRLVIPSHPELHDTANPASTGRPIRRRPSLVNPRVDLEDCDANVCPCCHLRRRPSAKAAELQSPKYVHTALDECCGNFCPDLSLSETVSPHTPHPHIGHSRLYQQLQSPHSLAGDQLVELQGTPIPPDQPFGRQCGQNGRDVSSSMSESPTSGIEEDDASYWKAQDFD